MTYGKRNSRRICLWLGAIAWLAAPAAAWPQSVEDTTDHQVEHKVDDDVEHHVEHEVDDKTDQKVDDQVSNQTDDQVNNQVEDSTGTTVDDSVGNQVDDSTGDQVDDNAGDEVGDNTGDQIDDNSGDQIDDHADDQAENEAGDAAGDQVSETVDHSVDDGGTAATEVVSEARPDVVGDSLELADLDTDPQGFAIARGEWLVMGNARDVASIAADGFHIRAEDRLVSLDQVVVRVAAPLNLPFDQAAARLHALAPGAVIDYNHLYSPQLAASRTDGKGDRPRQALAMPASADGVTKSIGLIDTAVVAAHPVFAGRHILQKDFVASTNGRPNDHGTAVASILIGHDDNYDGLVPNAHMYAASVFENLPGRDATATTMSLVRALDWMVDNRVGVVNMSLTGPDNQVLKAAIERARSRGILVVAAIGNDGPSGHPLFPAAYDDVVAVTATNSARQVFRLANRGPQLDFAAPGVDILHADPSGGLSASSGTSLAAPFVAAALLLASDTSARVSDRTLQKLEQRAIDLGKPGFDPVYGYGFINPLP